jgi:hypothetical protein
MFYLIIIFITILVFILLSFSYYNENNNNEENIKDFKDLLSNFDKLIEDIEGRFNNEIIQQRYIDKLKQENANAEENKKGILEGLDIKEEQNLLNKEKNKEKNKSDNNENNENNEKNIDKDKKKISIVGELEGINTTNKVKELSDLRQKIINLKEIIDKNIKKYNDEFSYENRILGYNDEKVNEFINNNPDYTTSEKILYFFLEIERNNNDNLNKSFRFKSNINNLNNLYKKFKSKIIKYKNLIDPSKFYINDFNDNKLEEYEKFIKKFDQEKIYVLEFIKTSALQSIEKYLNQTGGNGENNIKKEFLKFNNKKYLIRNDNISFYIKVGNTKKYLCKIDNNYKFC